MEKEKKEAEERLEKKKLAKEKLLKTCNVTNTYIIKMTFILKYKENLRCNFMAHVTASSS